MEAVKRGRVWVADGLTFFNRSSPRVVESAQIVAEAVWPELSGAAAASFNSAPIYILPTPDSKDYRMIFLCCMSVSRGTVQARSQVRPSHRCRMGIKATEQLLTNVGQGKDYRHARRSALHPSVDRVTWRAGRKC